MLGVNATAEYGHIAVQHNCAVNKMQEKQDHTKYTEALEEEKPKVVYDFEVVLEEIGGLGRYQCLLVLLVYYIGLPTGKI